MVGVQITKYSFTTAKARVNQYSYNMLIRDNSPLRKNYVDSNIVFTGDELNKPLAYAIVYCL